MRKLREIKDYVMTGLSYALPIIIAGSMIIGIVSIISVAMGSPELTETSTGVLRVLYQLEETGWAAITMLNLVFGAFISYSMAGKAGLASGFIAGSLASSNGTGFIGALLGGLFAGWLTKKVLDIDFPEVLQSVLSLVIVPLLTVLGTSLFIIIVIAGPFGWLNTQLNNWVTNALDSGKGMTGVFGILGGMMGFDLGGPVNKAAWAPAQALVFEGIYQPKIIINVAAAIPPLGYGLAFLINRDKFTGDLQQAGFPALVMGFLGITEGAIPFLIKSPRLVFVNVLGSGVGAALAAYLQVSSSIPPVGGIDGTITLDTPFKYLISIAVGASIVAAGALLLGNFDEEDTEEKEDVEIDLEFN